MMSELNDPLIDWLWERLRDREWLRADLARAVPIDPSQVSRWFKGTDRPSRENCIRLAEIFGATPNYVLALAGHEPMPSTEIDLSDPLISFAAMNQDKLSDEKKRAMVRFLSDWIASDSESQS